jgi:hypothetical protein
MASALTALGIVPRRFQCLPLIYESLEQVQQNTNEKRISIVDFASFVFAVSSPA